MQFIYTIGNYSAVKKNKIIKLPGKGTELKKEYTEGGNPELERQMSDVLSHLQLLAPSLQMCIFNLE